MTEHFWLHKAEVALFVIDYNWTYRPHFIALFLAKIKSLCNLFCSSESCSSMVFVQPPPPLHSPTIPFLWERERYWTHSNHSKRDGGEWENFAIRPLFNPLSNPFLCFSLLFLPSNEPWDISMTKTTAPNSSSGPPPGSHKLALVPSLHELTCAWV